MVHGAGRAGVYAKMIFYQVVLTTSAVSSTDLGSILVVASCAVRTCGRVVLVTIGQ